MFLHIFYTIIKKLKVPQGDHFYTTIVVAAFSNAGKKVFACKNEEAGDFLVDGVVIEVGGKNKAKKRADYIIRDNIDLPYGNVIPLWLLGFMY